jgi:hypothetical protein
MMKSTTLAIAMALAAPAATVTLAPAAQAAEEALSAEAAEFGRLYIPAELGIESAMAAFDAEFYGQMNAEPQVVAMDKQFPGLIKAAGDAARAILLTAMTEGLPRAQANMGRYVQSRFTKAELQDVNTYLASPAGQRFLQMAADSADTSKLSEKFESSGGDVSLSGEDLTGMLSPAMLTKLSAEDRSALMKFSFTPGGRKLNGMGAELASAVATEMNMITQTMKPKIETAVTEAIINHVSKPAG